MRSAWRRKRSRPVSATATCPTPPRPSARPARRWSARRSTRAGTALREQLVALAVADDGSPLHGADPGAVEVQDGRMTPARAARHRRDIRRAAEPQPHELRRGQRKLAPAAAGRPARAADVRRAVRRGRGRSGAWARAGPAHARRVRARAGHQPEARAQPAHGRDAVGPRPGAARGQPDGPAPRALGCVQPRRVPRAGQRRRARGHGRARRGRRTRASTRSASRASGRSARSASPRRSPTRSSTRPDAASASSRWPPSS